MTNGHDAISPARPAAERTPTEGRPSDYRPGPRDVEQLLAAACAHPLGIEFLMNGYLGSVAAIFGVHAFTVEDARSRAGGRQTKKDRDGLP